jgi:hypothetical protein
MDLQFGEGPVSWSKGIGLRRSLAVFARALLIVLLSCEAVGLQQVAAGASSSQILDTDRVYSLTTARTIHLKLALNQQP